MTNTGGDERRYYSLKIRTEDTKPLFIELKGLRMLQTGQSVDNVDLLHDIIKEALQREKQKLSYPERDDPRPGG